MNIAIAASQMDASTTSSPDPFTDTGGAKTTDTDGDRAQEGCVFSGVTLVNL